VIDAGDSRAALIPASHNYPGFAGIEGEQLLQRLRAQAQRYGVDLRTDRVTTLRKDGDAFTATCASRSEIQSAFVILATGLVDRRPPIHGQTTLKGCKAVRFCPICDAFEAMDGRIGVIGDVQSGGRKALFLRTYSKDVTLFPVGDDPRDAPSLAGLAEAGIAVAGKFSELHATPRDTVIVYTVCGKQHELDALYPALGCYVQSDLARDLGASSTSTGNLKVDDHQETTVDRLYAAGDVVTDLHQLSIAFGHAALAATQIHNRLPPNWR